MKRLQESQKSFQNLGNDNTAKNTYTLHFIMYIRHVIHTDIKNFQLVFWIQLIVL